MWAAAILLAAFGVWFAGAIRRFALRFAVFALGLIQLPFKAAHAVLAFLCPSLRKTS